MDNFTKKRNTGNTTQTTTTNETCCCNDTDTRKISETAYFLAEKNGFQGNQVDYWLEAEKQIKNHTTNNGTGNVLRKR